MVCATVSGVTSVIVSSSPSAFSPAWRSLLAARARRELGAFGQRPGQELALPGRIAHLRAEGEVGAVLAAQQVAVHQQRRLAVQTHHAGIGQQRGAGVGGEARPEQEVAVAAHQEQRHAAGAQPRQRLAHRSRQRIVGVVAQPGLEQVAEHVQRVGVRGLVAQEVQEQRGDGRARGMQVQVGNEQRGHRGLCPAGYSSICLALSISTGVTGTSAAKGGLGPVGTTRMRSMTSMPSTTRPNTQYPVIDAVASPR
jgi:hypothetical protein